jgi:hypothetical protein
VIIAIPTHVKKLMDKNVQSFRKLWNLPRNEPWPQNKPKPTAEQYFKDRLWIDDYRDVRPGIYLMLFAGVGGKDTDDVDGFAWYVGKTNKFGQRLKNHDDNIDDLEAPGQMYVKARTAKRRRMLVLCDYSHVKDPGVLAKILRASEHTWVCLLQSWTSVLTSDTVESQRVLTAYYFDRAMARAFQSLMKEVIAQTGWNTRLLIGLNWKTPLTELLIQYTSFICHVFTPSPEIGEVRSYRSTLRNVSVSGARGVSRLVTLFEGGSPARGRVILSLDPDIDWPKKIYLTVEILFLQGDCQNQDHSRTGMT